MGLLRVVAFTWIGRAAVGLVVIAVVGATVVAPRLTQAAPAALRTATVARGNVMQTSTVSGSVNAAALVKAAFRPSGRLSEILVKVGDAVTLGQPLARLDPVDLQTAVKQAEANVLSAQAKYDSTAAGASAEDLTLARGSLESATLTYEQSQKNAATDVSNAQSALDKAKRSLADARTTTANDVASALQTLNKVKTSYATAKANLASLAAGIKTDLGTYWTGLGSARSQISTAVSSLDAVSHTNDVSSARNSVLSADLSLTNAQTYVNGTLQMLLDDFLSAVASIVAATVAFDAAVAANRDTSSVASQYQVSQLQYTLAASKLTSATDVPGGQVASAQTSVSAAQSTMNSPTTRADASFSTAREDLARISTTLTAETQLLGAMKTKITQAGSAVTATADAVNGSLISAQQAYSSAQTRAQTTLQAAEDTAASAAQTLTTTEDKAASTLASSEVALSNARANYAKSTATPKSTDVMLAVATLQLAQIALDKARGDLENATLRAPAAGVISTLTNQVGEAPANPFAVIAVLSTLTLHGTVGESEVAKIRLGQVATLTVDAVASGTRLTGKVTSLDPVATLQQGVPVYGIDITIDRPDPAVRPGMTATATVILASKQGVLTVPNSAIRTVAGRRTVQILENGVAVDGGEVVFGIASDTVTEVVSGLAEGQTVVLPAPRTTTTTAGQGGQRLGGQVPGGAPPVIIDQRR